MGLLGDQGIELFLWNNAISINISSLNHFLEDVVVSKFSEVLGDLPQILEGDETFVGWDVPVFCESKVMNTLWT